ncbi:MAG TPA: protein kinase [Lacipirellulaceae bacterium]|nr:protein kinase [Lacipirellulaceae bacterium]
MHLSRIGPIALEAPLGGDAESNVLRGIHLERNRAMAVKLLPRHLVDRPMGGDSYAEDVRRLQKLVHPQIARVLGGAIDQGQPYLAMELVNGESLRRLLDRRGRLPWETMVELGEQIAESLAYAHEQGVVHRRLTPARVLVDAQGSVKVAGFDCALADQDAVAALRIPMNVAHYMAPQELRAKRTVGLPGNDLFSLGVILYEGLAGQLPWSAKTPAELVLARQKGPAPRVAATVLDCPVWLDVLVARLLELKREGRFASADEARRAFIVAKSKVAAGTGAVQQAWSGRQGSLAVGGDQRELSRLRKASAPAARDASPFYERAWFLALCLAAVVGAGAWIMWPPTDEALYAKALPLMQSELVTDWQRAQSQYLSELSPEFLAGPHAAEIEEFRLRHAMHQAEERVTNIDRFGRKPASEFDKLYAEAWRYDRFGDDLRAWQKYEALLNLHAEDTELRLEDRAILELAKLRIAEIREESRQQQRDRELAEILQEKLDRARGLAESNPVAARELLESLVSLYDGNPDAAAQVEAARAQIRALHQ